MKYCLYKQGNDRTFTDRYQYDGCVDWKKWLLMSTVLYGRRQTLFISYSEHHLCACVRTSKNIFTSYTLTAYDAFLRILERIERVCHEKHFTTWMHCSAIASTRDTQGFYQTANCSCALQGGYRLASRSVCYKRSRCYVVMCRWPLCGSLSVWPFTVEALSIKKIRHKNMDFFIQ